jgi:hypothetical protein
VRNLLLLVIVVGLLAAPRPAWALDYMTMPLADQMPPGGFEAGWYFIDLADTPEGTTRANLYQTAFGFANQVELSYLTLRPDNGPTLKAFNLSYEIAPETLESWATTVGVYNLFSNSYFRGSKPSFFVAAAKTMQVSQRAAGGQPVYRAFFGYGTKSHDGWFYGAQTILDSQISGIVARYAGQSIYGLSYALQDKQGSPIAHVGTLNGDPFYGISLSRLY